MTYAELYGNIKKRPLKCGLGNKLIDEIGFKSAIDDDYLGLNKFVKAGDTMAGFTKLVSPINQLNESLSNFNNPMTELKNLVSGIHNALSISNYR